METAKLVKSVSAGVYPSPPARFEYVVAKGPFSGTSKDFIIWILTDGQKFVSQNGYVTLSHGKLEEEMEKIKAVEKKAAWTH